MSVKSLLYDLTGFNVALFDYVVTGTPQTLAPLTWVGSNVLGNYWLAPLVICVMWWSARQSADVQWSAQVQTEIKNLIVALLLAVIAVVTFKQVIDAPRPFAFPDGRTGTLGEAFAGKSFPSGHVTYATVVAASLWQLINQRLRLLLIAYVALVSWSRIAMGAHFPVDVLGGWTVGAVCSALAGAWVRGLQRVPAPPGGGFWYTLAVSLALLDQLTKGFAADILVQGGVQPITSFFNFVHLRNDGAAFSLLAGEGAFARALLIGINLAVSGWLMFQLRGAQMRLETVGYCMILGGAAGNLLDRASRGEVVDFLDFHYAGVHWPAFNLADVFIVSGVIAVILSSLYAERRAPKHEPTAL